MLEKYIYKEEFVEYYSDKDIEIVIYDMSRTVNALKQLEEIDLDPINILKRYPQIRIDGLTSTIVDITNLLVGWVPTLEESVIGSLPNLLKSNKIKNNERYFEATKEYRTILNDLMRWYREILKERHEEL